MKNKITLVAVATAIVASGEMIRMKLTDRPESKDRESELVSKLKLRILNLQSTLNQHGLYNEQHAPDDNIPGVYPQLIYFPTDGPDSVGGPDGDWPIAGEIK